MASMVRHATSAFCSGQTSALARQIAERSLPASRRAVRADTASMSAGELRGYVRARSLPAVRAATEQMAATCGWDECLVDDLVERALERTVTSIVRELTGQPILVMPIFEPMRRAAA
jgi:hypothetical protein